MTDSTASVAVGNKRFAVGNADGRWREAFDGLLLYAVVLTAVVLIGALSGISQRLPTRAPFRRVLHLLRARVNGEVVLTVCWWGVG